MRIVVAHLYPDYLNIYADRGNIAVLERRAAWRGIAFDYRALSLGDRLVPGEHDLLYVGGGQDREQALIAPDLAARGEAIREAVAGGAAVLAVCGGYQLLGRFYRGRDGAELPGAGLFPHETVAGERRMIGDVLLECDLAPGRPRTLAGFENHAGRTRRRGLRQRWRERRRGLPRGPRPRHVPARAAPPPQPVARRLAARAGPRPPLRRRPAGARAARGRPRSRRPRGRRRPGQSSRWPLRLSPVRGTPAHHPA
jgi:hypothetical protein